MRVLWGECSVLYGFITTSLQAKSYLTDTSPCRYCHNQLCVDTLNSFGDLYYCGRGITASKLVSPDGALPHARFSYISFSLSSYIFSACVILSRRSSGMWAALPYSRLHYDRLSWNSQQRWAWALDAYIKTCSVIHWLLGETCIGLHSQPDTSGFVPGIGLANVQ